MIKAVVFDFARVLLFPKNNSYKGSIDSLWEELAPKTGFKFFDCFYLNSELFKIVKRLKNKGIGVYVLTAGKVEQDPALAGELKESFDQVFSALRMGVSKNKPEIYIKLIQELGVNSDEVIYVDDKLENVEAARSAGLTAFKYESNTKIIPLIKKETGF